MTFFDIIKNRNGKLGLDEGYNGGSPLLKLGRDY
jgi:hypothetical protein